MADVTVEFGAQDVGLQKTLSKIQDEMAGLRSSVKSGELSMEELEKTMRRIGQVESMEKRIKAMGDNSAESAAQVNRLESELRQLDRANDSVNAGGISFGKLTGAISGAYAAIMGFQEAFMFIGDSIKKSSDLAETMNKVNVVFGSAAGAVADFAATAVQELGMTRQQALDAASTFAVFGKSAGLAGGELVGFSRNLVQLATDFASFYNTSPEEAIQAIGAALRGESEPIRKYGILLDDATLKAEAMKLGLYDGKGAIDSQAKALAAYNAILGQSGIAQGDFANTSGSVSNQLKILSATYAELKTSIGDGLQKPTLEVVSTLNNDLIPAMQGAIKYGKEFLDFLSSTPDNTTVAGRSVNAVAESLNGFNYWMNEAVKFISPMDDLMMLLRDKGTEAGAGQEAAAKGVQKVGETAAAAASKFDQAASFTQNWRNHLGELGGSAQYASGKLTKASLEAAAASGEFSGLASKAEDTGNSIASAFTINSDFKPTVDGISSGWSDLNSKIAGTKPLLEGNFSLTDSITGKVEEQTQSIGGQNEQLETASELKKLLLDTETKRTEKEKEAAAKQAERQAGLRENLELDLSILKAQISGNEEEVKALNYQKDYNAALKQAIDAGMGKSEAEAFADQIARARQEQAGINKELTASQKLLKDIADAEGKEGIDKGGRLAKRAQDQVARGDFEGARKTASKIAENEAQAALTGVGQNRDRRDMADIGKDYGLNRGLGESSSGFSERIRAAREDGVYNDFSKTAKPSSRLEEMKAKGSLKDELAARRAEIDKPGQDGQKPPARGDSEKKSGGKNGLDGLVEKILELVQKIEPKLPVAALV